MLDNANYPYEPEWMSSVLNPANFQGYRGEYGGYFNGGRYSYEFEVPTITYEMAYCPHLEVINEPISVSEAGETLVMMALALTVVYLVGLFK